MKDGSIREVILNSNIGSFLAVDRVRNQEYVVPSDGSEDDRCGGQDAVYDE